MPAERVLEGLVGVGEGEFGAGDALGDGDGYGGRAGLFAVLGCDGGDEGCGDEGELHFDGGGVGLMGIFGKRREIGIDLKGKVKTVIEWFEKSGYQYRD